MSSSNAESRDRKHRRTKSAPLQQSPYLYHRASCSSLCDSAGFITPNVVDQPEFGPWRREISDFDELGCQSFEGACASSSSTSLRYSERKSASTMSLPSLMDGDAFTDSQSSDFTSRGSSLSFSSSSSSSIDPHEHPQSSWTTDELVQQDITPTSDALSTMQRDNRGSGNCLHRQSASHTKSENGRDLCDPVGVDALSLIPIRQAVSVSFYLFLSIVTALSLLSILLASYGLTLADDLKVRVGKAVEQATDMKEWVKANSASDSSEREHRYKRASSSGTQTPRSGYTTPPSGMRTPEAREFNDEKPSRSLLYTLLSLASLAIIPFVLKVFGRKSKDASASSTSNSSTPSDRHAKSSSSNIPPRPPLKTLIPSIILALMIALLGFATASSTSTMYKSNRSPKSERSAFPNKTRSKPRS